MGYSWRRPAAALGEQAAATACSQKRVSMAVMQPDPSPGRTASLPPPHCCSGFPSAHADTEVAPTHPLHGGITHLAWPSRRPGLPCTRRCPHRRQPVRQQQLQGARVTPQSLQHSIGARRCQAEAAQGVADLPARSIGGGPSRWRAAAAVAAAAPPAPSHGFVRGQQSLWLRCTRAGRAARGPTPPRRFAGPRFASAPLCARPTSPHTHT